MVRIMFTTHPIKPIVSSGADLMASNEVLEISSQQREASVE
jgi:hypothetical protein